MQNGAWVGQGFLKNQVDSANNAKSQVQKSLVGTRGLLVEELPRQKSL
jgi:hypothetical protein